MEVVEVMGDTAEKMSKPAQLDDQAQRNRERFPEFAAWLETIRAFDPGAKVRWVREGNEMAGNVPEEERGKCST